MIEHELNFENDLKDRVHFSDNRTGEISMTGKKWFYMNEVQGDQPESLNPLPDSGTGQSFIQMKYSVKILNNIERYMYNEICPHPWPLTPHFHPFLWIFTLFLI